MKLTYANEVAKSHGRPRRLGGSEIGFRVLSGRHQSSFPLPCVRYRLIVWCVSLMFKCRAQKKATNSLEQSQRDQTKLGFDERSKDDSFRTFPPQQYNP